MTAGPATDQTLDQRVRVAELHATARSAAAKNQRVPAVWKRYGG